ncbi:MAG: hypothetical protein M1832_002549 [Thelocarpon impressellum]|nr:MAG: hypothetical protein M1832_002549 [Thelocarpon impressellum]
MFSEHPAIARMKEIAVPPPAGSPYSLPLPGSERPGRSKVYRHWRFQDEMLQTLDPAITTAHEMFESTANRLPTNKCLGHRPYDPVKKTFGNYVWQDYRTVQQRRAAFGVGLVELHKSVGVTGRQYGIGLWCQNRPEWQLTDLACMSQSLFSISIYDSLGPETTEFIINHASLVCVATTLTHIPTLLKLKPRLPSLKLIISLDPLDAGELPGQSKADLLQSWAGELGVKIYSIYAVEALGRATPRPYNAPRPDDIITINYTSGTTGNPKGVVLTHANAVAATSNGLISVPQQSTDVVCSYLPLAHIYERVSQHSSLWAGAAIGFFHGNIVELVDDLKLLRPTAFISVPRLYNRFGGAIRAATVEQDGFKGALSRHIVATKLENLKGPNGTVNHVLYDRIWGRKVTSAFGLDRVRTMVSGSAPLDPSLHQFLRVVFGNHFLQGYGLTETYAVSTSQAVGDYSAGNCGAIAPCSEACLMDVPDMDYLTTDKPQPRGELLLRGNTLFREYFRSEAETKKAILEDGWFRTGDICTVDAMGRFTIVDRVKNVLKLAQGEYISPERIENVYLSNCSWMAQAYVHGDSVQTFLVAIFGVQPDVFAPWASKILGTKVAADDRAALHAAAQDPRVRKAVIKELDHIGKRGKFNSYERVRNCYLYVEPFTVENELLTPTLKLKRPQTAKKHRTDLDKLYEEALAEEKGRARL